MYNELSKIPIHCVRLPCARLIYVESGNGADNRAREVSQILVAP